MRRLKRFLIRPYEIYNALRRNLHVNYRYHGGALSAFRCLIGTLHSHLPCSHSKEISKNQVDVLTFSIVPSLTLVWLAFIERFHQPLSLKIFVGDCSGGIMPGVMKSVDMLETIPYVNDAHGQKLDLFLARYCRAEYVLISDDDIFFLSRAPLDWGLAQMQADPNLAVVSFVPRERFTWQINNEDHIPMGSYCLLIRRATWLKEKLSFRTVHETSININSYMAEYDTADYANVALIRKGYRVLIAPSDVRAGIHVCKGISGTLWEAQTSPVKMSLKRFSRPLHVVYANISLVEKLVVLADCIFPGLVVNEPAWGSLISQALTLLRKNLPIEAITFIDQKIEKDMALFESILAGE